MASNAAAVSGLAPASTTDDVPDVSPLTKSQVTYTAIVALLAGQGADLLETRGWDDLASGVIEASYS